MKKRLKLKKSVLKKFILLIILFILILLFYITYYIYSNSRIIEEYDKNTNTYSYLIIKEMSEVFATIDSKELHFIKDKKNRTYIIAVPKKDKNKYRKIIDYTYGKIDKTKSVKVYGLPIKSNNEIKKLVIKYINKFLPLQEKIPITEENYNKYLPNTILDTTIKENYNFNYIVFILFLIFGIFFLLLIKLIFFKKYQKKVLV